MDGTELRGEILEETGVVVRIAVQKGGDRVVVDVPRGAVRAVRRLGGEPARLAAAADAALVAGDVEGAIAALRRLAALVDDARSQRELGFALLLAGRPAEAMPALARACALDPIDLEAHLQLAHAVEATGQVDEAIDAWRRATRLGPRHVQAWRSLARLLLARAQPRDGEEALRALELAARQDPAHEGVVLDRARALVTTSSPAWLTGPLQGAPEPAGAGEARALLAAFVERRAAEGAGAPNAARLLAELEARRGAFAAARDRAAEAAARSDVPAEVRARLAAEAARWSWHQDGCATPAPPDLDAGQEGADLAWAEQGLSLLLEGSAAGGDDGRLWLARARVRLRAGRADAAAEDLEQAALAGATGAGVIGAVVGDALLLQEARVALAAGRPLLADAAPLKAARLAGLMPWEPAAHAAHGQALLRDGRPADAGRAFDRAAARARSAEERALHEAAAASARDEAERRRRNAGT